MQICICVHAYFHKYMYVYLHELQYKLYPAGGVTSATACDASHVLCCLQDGWSALMTASSRGHTEVTDKLISASAELDLQNKVRESGVPCG